MHGNVELSAAVSAGVQAALAALQCARPPVPTQETLARFLAWQKARKTPHSWSTDRGYLERFFRTVPVADLRELAPAAISDYLAGRAAAGRAPKTLNREREVLHTFCEWLVEREQLERNPVARVRRAEEPAPRIRFLSLPQVDELLSALAVDPLLQNLAATCVFAGVRRGEACWLRWEDVDLERRLLTVRAKADGGWQPKTRRNRVVPIAQRLAPFLGRAARSSEWLHPSPQGKRWCVDNLAARWRHQLRALTLPWRLLDLRHTFGTQLVMRNVSLAKVAALMGNSPEICRRHYAHVSTEELHRDVEF